MKTEQVGFSTLAGVFDPGEGGIGPAFIKIGLIISSRRIQRRWSFLQDRSWFRLGTAQVPLMQNRTLLLQNKRKKRRFFASKTRLRGFHSHPKIVLRVSGSWIRRGRVFPVGAMVGKPGATSYPEKTTNVVACVSLKS